ncbi:MAG: hypothetical protein QOI11_3370, partial [Candidatus Eremiobacteraeota bacterium]|nr:hypothetical protein [Candidatus Eremiobacteraeota bacterium]
VADLGAPVLDLLGPQPGEDVLDLGCGDGALTRTLAASGARVVGVDASPELAAAAAALGLDIRVADGQRLPFEAAFDAVFSNAALHWMPDADAVLAGVHRALRPRGRFVGELGGHGNVAAICTALLATLAAHGVAVPRVPWYFPTPAEYAAKLEAHGFAVDTIALIPRPTPLPTGMRGWLDTFADPFLQDVPAAERGAVLDDVSALLAPTLRDRGGRWTADYVRLRFAARRTG